MPPPQQTNIAIRLFCRVATVSIARLRKDGIVADPVDQWDAAENEITRSLDGRLFERKLNDGSNAQVESITKIPSVASMANPQRMRLDLIHGNLLAGAIFSYSISGLPFEMLAANRFSQRSFRGEWTKQFFGESVQPHHLLVSEQPDHFAKRCPASGRSVRVMQALPNLRIVVGRWGCANDREKIIGSFKKRGTDQVVLSLAEDRDYLTRLMPIVPANERTSTLSVA
jgi:hypothetical protein